MDRRINNFRTSLVGQVANLPLQPKPGILRQLGNLPHGTCFSADPMAKCLLAAWLALFPIFPAEAAPIQTILLSDSGPGRTFEGLGALSAGASSRLLPDYPERQRNDLLDLLFKPNFGASLNHLKIEVGGDVNSTDGAEPSYARTREEFDHPRPEYFDRGYEWWLMREAKRRNPKIYLDILQWGAPDWIGDRDFPDFGDPNRWLWNDRVTRNVRKFYTQDNADFIVGFIRGAKNFHGVDIDFCGVWNETLYDTSWIKLLRATLDRRGLSRVGIVAADEIYPWTIANALERDEALKNAVRVVGTHYPDARSTPAAKQCGRPLWASEDGPGRPWDWAGACFLAKALNRNYITGRMTKTVVWSLIAAYYDSLPAADSGPIEADSPWSGHYEIHPALWIIAHTTQFAQPGWRVPRRRLRALEGRRQLRLPAKSRRCRSVQPDHRDHRRQDAANRLVPHHRPAGRESAARLAQQPGKPIRPAGRHLAHPRRNDDCA